MSLEADLLAGRAAASYDSGYVRGELGYRSVHSFADDEMRVYRAGVFVGRRAQRRGKDNYHTHVCTRCKLEFACTVPNCSARNARLCFRCEEREEEG